MEANMAINNPIVEGYRIMREWFIREIVNHGKEISQNIPTETPRDGIEGGSQKSKESE